MTLLVILCFKEVVAQTLKDAVQESMMTHPDILFNRAETLSAKKGMDQAKDAYWPTIDLNGSYGREWTQSPFTQDLAGDNNITLNRRELNLALVQNIFSGGGIVGEVARNRFLVQSQYYKTLGVSNDIALQVTEAFLNVIMQERIVNLLEKNLVEHRRLLKLIELRSAAGISRTSDLFQGQSRVAFAESNLINAQGSYQEAQIQYKKLVGSWPDHLLKVLVPQKRYLPMSVDEGIAQALDIHPYMKQSLADIDQAKAQHKLSKSGLFPKVDAVVSGFRNKNMVGVPGPSNENLGAIRVSYNLFKGGADLDNIKKTAYQVQAAFETRAKIIINLKESVRLAYNALNISRKNSKALADYVRNTKKTKSAYFEQFQTGQRSFLDLLNTQNEEVQAEINYTKSKNTELMSQYRILGSMGVLIPFLFDKPVVVTRILNQKISSNQRNVLAFDKPVNANTSPKKTPKNIKHVAKQREKFTIQLLASKDHNKLKQFIQKSHKRIKTRIIPIQVSGKQWYVLTTGEFDTAEQAAQALKQVFKEYASLKPWIRFMPGSPGARHS